jgi:hypothetical protein
LEFENAVFAGSFFDSQELAAPIIGGGPEVDAGERRNRINPILVLK